MRAVSSPLWFMVFTSLWTWNFAMAAEVRPEVQELEGRLEERLRAGLRSFLGPDATSVATVRVKPGESKKEAKDAKPGSAAEKRGAPADEDYGYLPIPPSEFDGRLLEPEQEKPLLTVASVDVDIRFSPTSADEKKQQAEVRAFAEQLFSGYSPKVNVAVLKLPPLPKPATEPGRDPASKAPTVEEPPLWKASLPYGVAVLCVLILAGAFFAIARGMSKAAEVVTGGILQIRAAMSEATAAARPQKKEEPKKEAKDPEVGASAREGKSFALPPEVLAQTEAHAVRVIKEVLTKEPGIFTRTLGREPVDLQGLRRLLPFLEEPEQKALKAALGESFFEELSETFGTEEMKFDEFSLWARRLAERVVVRRAQGANVLESELGTEGILELSGTSSSQLIEAVRKVGTPSAWRVAAEFLSSEQFTSLVASAQGSELRAMLESAALPPSAWVEGARAVLAEVSSLKASGVSQSDKKVQGFIRTKLFRPVLATFESKPFGEDDQYLSQLEVDSPALVAMVREAVWTTQELKRVPATAWSRFVKGLGNEDRVALILSFPEELSEVVRSAVPEGNARTMVLDRVKKQLAKNDPEAQKLALIRSRELVSELRLSAEQGEFQLDEGAAAA
jgi:hypothetical protein